MGCCQNCDQGTGPCIDVGAGSALATRQPQRVAMSAPRRSIGAISTATIAGLPVVAAVGAAGGGWGGWALASMVSKKSMLLKVLGAAAGAYAGYTVAPKVTDAVGL